MDILVRRIYEAILKHKRNIEVVEDHNNIYRIYMGKLPFKYLCPRGIKPPVSWTIRNNRWYNGYKQKARGY